VLLFAVILIFLLLIPIVHHFSEVMDPTTPPIIDGLGFCFVVGGIVATVSRSLRARLLTLAMAIFIALMVMLHSQSDIIWIAVFHHIAGIAFLGYVIAVLFHAIFKSSRVTINTVFASLCIFVLLSILWAFVYSIIYRLDSNAFYSSVPGNKSSFQMSLGKGH